MAGQEGDDCRRRERANHWCRGDNGKRSWAHPTENESNDT